MKKCRGAILTKKVLSILFAVVLTFQVLAGSAAATTFTVDDDGPGNYTTIQSAVNEAVYGDTIVVKEGTYPENVNMTVSGLTFKGEDYPEVYGFYNDGVIGSNFETIQGFSIVKDGILMRGAVDGHDSIGNVITNNRFQNCGVSLSAMEYGGFGDEDHPGDAVTYNVFHGGGISLSYGGDGSQKIIGNEIYDADYGVIISSGAGASNHIGEISGNKIQGCDVGLDLRLLAEVDEVYNNVFNNTVNVQIELGSGVHTWNKSALIQETNIIGGPYVGGNYWATPAGNGFSQTHTDTDGDGIAEEEYKVAEGVVDYFPLVTPLVESEPVANFNTNVTTGDAPLSVQFTDASQNANSWSWNFDNDGTQDSNLQNPIHVYEVPGVYTVTLTVSNDVDTASKTKDITVTERSEPEPEDNRTADVTPDTGNDTNSTDNTADDSPSSSGGSSHKSSGSSSSGGGGGGSPEPAKNVEVKELAQVFITNGKAVKFEFTKNATCVVSVDFDAIKNVGKTTTIVEQLKNKSALVPDLPAGETYKSFNVWVGNSGYATSKNIENPGLTFKVAKAWIQDKGIDKNSITLNRYVDENNHDGKDGAWTELQSSPAGEDDKFLYFLAETPGYGSFAISGAPTLQVQEEEKITAESRAAGDIQESNETEEPESNKNKNTVLSLGIVTGALVVVGVVLKSMKK